MGTSWTLNARVVLTGPDPVPQLPVNLDGFRSNRLHTKKAISFYEKEENKRTTTNKKNKSAVHNPLLFACLLNVAKQF